MNIKLFQLEPLLKKLLITYLCVLSIGVVVGLIYLYTTTNYSVSGTITRFKGSEQQNIQDDFEIPENYAKPISEMLISTHNHIFGLSFIFLSMGLMFYFNSILNGFWKSFLMIEPFISILTSFGSIWGMRYISNTFVFLAVISALLMYLSFFVMLFILLFELLLKKTKGNL